MAQPLSFYDKNQLCSILQISRPTLDVWLRAGKLPALAVKIGHKTLFPRAEFDAAIASLMTV
ncbi:MAG: helix-turn-helix domain-containing protein, partial [Nitrospirae bacterium]|nr:helix-turn-helix domain-containing protein [Nitrospirota bacterium]